ncbi:hypothetical protein B0H14DRAFT_2584636 [Mycena olivaceomarginata]|nr:hypothetical protein B0H14DRAFT_2584636 [Mycena olivaceomarginata]
MILTSSNFAAQKPADSANSTVTGRRRPSRVLRATTSASGALIPKAIRKKFSGPDELIKTYVPEEHPLWVIHFERMLYATNRSEEWSLWLEYDSQVCRRALNEVFDPLVFQTQIWTQLQAKHIKNSVVKLLGPLSKSGGGKAGRSGGANDNRGEHPYNVSDRPPRDRDNSNSFRTYSRCFFCGSSEPGHTSRVCTSRQIVNGKPAILIFKKQGANRKDRDGEAYCYSFNGRNGCSGVVTATKGSIGAPSAATKAAFIQPRTAPQSDFLPIITPLLPDKWEATLDAANLLRPTTIKTLKTLYMSYCRTELSYRLAIASQTVYNHHNGVLYHREQYLAQSPI